MKAWFSKNNSNLFVLGFVSSSVQFLIVKEIMNISGGYELIAGVFLGAWLFLSALGSWLGGISKYNNIGTLYILFSISPLISLLLLALIAIFMINPGETISFIDSLLLTIIITAPVCLITGFIFIRLIERIVLNERTIPGKSFSIETIGDIAAGIFISILSSGFINTYILLLTIIILSFTYTLITFYITDKKRKKITYIVAAITIFALALLKPDLFFRNLLLQGADINYTKDTAYGNISIAEKGTEKNIFYDHRLIAYNEDVIDREEDIHYAMLQREHHDNVLIISGDIDSHIYELEKYNVKRITYIERDPWLASLTSTEEAKPQKTDLHNNKHNIILRTDAYTYIKSDTVSYDAIILLVPPPSTLSLNRFFTKDFFKMAKKRLTEGGVLLCSPGPAENYPGDESIKLYSSIFNSLIDVFQNVQPVIGNKLFFIASDDAISVAFGSLTEQAGINNSYVNKYYLADDITAYKSNEMKNWFRNDIKQNTIANPITCFYYQTYNLSKYANLQNIAIVVLVIIILLPLCIIKRNNILMFFSASALSGFEMMALFMLQVTAGNMYRITGLVIATIMAGLAIGSGIEIRLLGKYDKKKKVAFIAVYYAIIGLLFPILMIIKQVHIAVIIILSLTILPSIVTGNLFRELTYNNGKGTATSHVYCADLTGSATGFVIVSALLIPIVGLQLSLFVLALLNLLGIFIAKIK